MHDDRPQSSSLVTGCAGFVGGRLAARLLAQGQAVVGVDDFSTGSREVVARLARWPGFAFHETSILEPDLLPRLKRIHSGLARVLHLAAVVSVPDSLRYPQKTRAVNLDASLALHDSARRLGLETFVFAGSAAEYRTESRMPQREEYAAPETPRLSPYGEYKFLVSRHIQESGFGASLRCFNLYGPGQRPNSGVVSRFLDMALAGRPFTVFGDGGQTRDFVFVDDAVATFTLAAGLAGERSEPLAGVFNVGTQRPTDLLTLARTIAGMAGAPFIVRHLPEREGDIRHSLADVSRLRRATGFAPETPLSEGLARTLDWMRTGAAGG